MARAKPPAGWWSSNKDALVAVALFLILMIMVVPLPPLALDLFLSTSIASALLMVLVTVYVKDPVEFSVFPTLLLGTTMFRLALNLATTRQILLHGAESAGAAGGIVMTFGKVLVGGDTIVGVVVFVILVVINFIVITKGAGRVAEVSARFTLDAMPGKQMAVDAELNSGAIDEKQARLKRAAIAREADFYGAMDGASKFIRGDAIAAILITLVNIVGGLLVGVLQHGITVEQALENYTILTIGDGLVSQIPSLVVSVAAGILVTRVPDPDGDELGDQVSRQVFGSPRVLALLGAGLFAFALVPGLRIPFLALGGIASAMAWSRNKTVNETEVVAPDESGSDLTRDPEPAVETLLHVEPLAIEVGVELIGLVDQSGGGDQVERIQRVRRTVAADLGIIVPPVHLRDNLALKPAEYQILLRGERIGGGVVMPRQLLAIDPGETKKHTLAGVRTKDPVYGLDALWIRENDRLPAQSAGFTVVDVPTVLTTHLTEVLARHADEILDRRQFLAILDRVSETNPRLVDDLIPEILSRGVVHAVFKNLLREGLSVKDAELILEALADHAPRVKNPDVLTEFVRGRLARHITRRFTEKAGELRFIGLTPNAELAITEALKPTENAGVTLALTPELTRRLVVELKAAWDRTKHLEPVLLAPALARAPLRRIVEKIFPEMPVVSAAELLPNLSMQRVAAVSLDEAKAA